MTLIATNSITNMYPNLPGCGERRARRVRRGLRQADLAERLGVDRATVSRWERDAVRPRGPARRAYADLLSQLAGDA